MSEFDQDLQVGDIIVALHVGFHRVTGIRRRFFGTDGRPFKPGQNNGDEFASLIYYQTVMKEDGTLLKKPGRDKSCDAGWCDKIDKVFIKHRRAGVERMLMNLCELTGIPYAGK